MRVQGFNPCRGQGRVALVGFGAKPQYPLLKKEIVLFVCFALPQTILAYFRKISGNNNFIVCKFFQVIPAYFSAEIKSVSGKTVFINGVYFCVIFALAVYVVRAVGAYNITAVRQNKYRIFSVKNINNTAHTADKIFTVSFTNEKLYAQAVMRTEIKV